MFTVTRDGMTLYLKSWEYNAMRIFEQLRQIAADHGDIVRPSAYTVTIINASEEDERRDATARLELLRQIEAQHPNTNEARTNAIRHYEEIVAAEPADPALTVPAATWVDFKHDGCYIYFQMDSNPFFEFYYNKTPISPDGTRSGDACLMELQKDWLVDALWRKGATDQDIYEAAEAIYELLISSPCAKIRRDSQKIRVPNRYDGGCHYETVLTPERRIRLDF